MGQYLAYHRHRADEDQTRRAEILRALGADDAAVRAFVEESADPRERRPALTQCLAEAAPGDTLTVWSLDRVGRSLPHLVSVLHDLLEHGVSVRAIKGAWPEENRDHLVNWAAAVTLTALLDEARAAMASERVNAGLTRARATGTQLGRRSKLTAEDDQAMLALAQEQGMDPREIARRYGVHPSTVRRHLARARGGDVPDTTTVSGKETNGQDGTPPPGGGGTAQLGEPVGTPRRRTSHREEGE